MFRRIGGNFPIFIGLTIVLIQTVTPVVWVGVYVLGGLLVLLGCTWRIEEAIRKTAEEAQPRR